MMVGLDEQGLVHDFYFPYVGLDSLTNARSLQHKIGVWVDGDFSWTDDKAWQIKVDFEDKALISNIKMTNNELGIELDFSDFTDQEYTAFIRRIKITNNRSEKRDIRLFMHQVFQLSQNGRADTAIYVPEYNYILNYKGRRCLVIGGKAGDEYFDQFAVGNYAVEGKAGTYVDAEDGELSGNLVEHGGVDSTLRFRSEVDGHASWQVDYWIVADSSHGTAREVHSKLQQESIEHRLQLTRDHFAQWLHPAEQKIEHFSEQHRRAITKGLLIIKSHCDNKGSILASGDSSIYNYGRDYYCYCWPRDAAYALWPLIRLGIYDEAKNFFNFARSVLHRDGYLLHKYQPDRSIGSSWHPRMQNGKVELAIQEDETAGVLFMMREYFDATKDIDLVSDYFDDFIKPAADFMANFIDDQTKLPHASYDLWEQKFATHTYTVAITIGALDAASYLARELNQQESAIAWEVVAEKFRNTIDTLYNRAGYFRKSLLLQADGQLEFDEVVDISSLYGCFMYARLPLNDERLTKTADTVIAQLYNQSPAGGVIRYPGDGYFLSDDTYPGNPWIVCSMWLAQYLVHSGNTEEAQKLVDWALSKQTASGMLSEQFDAKTGQPVGVTPLVWSHAELINSLLDLNLSAER